MKHRKGKGKPKKTKPKKTDQTSEGVGCDWECIRGFTMSEPTCGNKPSVEVQWKGFRKTSWATLDDFSDNRVIASDVAKEITTATSLNDDEKKEWMELLKKTRGYADAEKVSKEKKQLLVETLESCGDDPLDVERTILETEHRTCCCSSSAVGCTKT